MEALERHERPDAGAAEWAELLSALEHGVLRLEAGRIVWANPAMERITRRGCPELIGCRLSDLLADPDGRPLSDPSRPEAVRMRDARGDLVPVSLKPLRGSLLLVIDRSRESRLEREVWRLTQELRRAGDVAPGADRPRDEFFGMIEHEIRTATTVIRGYNRMLLDERVGALNDSQCGFLRETRRATERISSLLDNLLEMASLECPSGIRVNRRPVALHTVVRLAVEGVRPLLEDRAMQAELDLQAEPDAISADAGRLEQVLLNLLTNAAKFGPSNGTVRVETRTIDLEAGPAIQLDVRDQGEGVPEADAERIFAPFVQGEAGASLAGSGVGLGLAICRRILEAHGGTIESVTGEPGGVFRVTLPLDR